MSSELVNQTIVYRAPGIPDLAVNGNDLVAIIGFLRSEFTGNTLELGVAAPETFGVGVSLAAQNLTEALSRMMERMTERIANGPNRQVVVGDSFERVVFVEAWYFLLALPAFVTVTTLLLLLFTMWRSRASTGAVLWKSSATALLYHVPTRSDDPRLTGGALQCAFRDPEELEQMTKSSQVQRID